MITLTSPKETKAIKRHYCDFCNEKIITGEKYIKSTHVLEGQVYDWKTHKKCHKLAHDLDMYTQSNNEVTQAFFMEAVDEKHFEILLKLLPKEGYEEIKRQLTYVNFREKLRFVIRFFIKASK